MGCLMKDGAFRPSGSPTFKNGHLCSKKTYKQMFHNFCSILSFLKFNGLFKLNFDQLFELLEISSQ